MDLDGKMEKLSGQPLLELLSQFYWNVTDFDGAGQMETWNLQVELIYIFVETCAQCFWKGIRFSTCLVRNEY